jgi:hypothetical protein
MTSYRILITGSRDWTDEKMIREALLAANADNPYQWKTILVHGGARGADQMAAEIAHSLGWSIETHRARWNHHDDNCPAWHEGEPVCKRAGHRRNEEMVKLGADICLAFIKNNSAGATGCAKSAEKFGIPTERFVIND